MSQDNSDDSTAWQQFFDCMDPISNNGVTTMNNFDIISEIFPVVLHGIIKDYVLCAVTCLKCDIQREKGWLTTKHTLYVRNTKKNFWENKEFAADRFLMYATTSFMSNSYTIYNSSNKQIASLKREETNLFRLFDNNGKSIGEVIRTPKTDVPADLVIKYNDGKLTLASAQPQLSGSSYSMKFRRVVLAVSDKNCAFANENGSCVVECGKSMGKDDGSKNEDKIKKEEGRYELFFNGGLSPMQAFAMYLLRHLEYKT